MGWMMGADSQEALIDKTELGRELLAEPRNTTTSG
jgi:hypothetical protein